MGVGGGTDPFVFVLVLFGLEKDGAGATAGVLVADFQSPQDFAAAVTAAAFAVVTPFAFARAFTAAVTIGLLLWN